MNELEALAREAAALAGGKAGGPGRPGGDPGGPARADGSPGGQALSRGLPGDQSHAAEAEAARMLQICNACRYCEGFCAVFPAMTRRLEFAKADVHYLANLCHHCGACLHACQYAPPHEFAVSLPRTLAQLRAKTYADYAWPPAMGALYQRSGLTVALALALGLALFLILAVALNGSLWHKAVEGDPVGNFYAVFPHGLMVALFAPVFGLACLALGMGVRRFWCDVASDLQPAAGGDGAAVRTATTTTTTTTTTAATLEATANVLTLKYLGGGQGQGCNEADDRFTLWRRRFHHATFYGFAACFAATGVATLYHYALGLPAPYALTSLPVLLGTAGGTGLLIGPAGLFWLHRKRHAQHADPAQAAMDHGLIVLLFFTSLTGLALMALRGTGAMALLLAIHLGFVMALFLTMPYGKFAHGIFRAAALLKWAIEKRQPSRLRLRAD